MAAHEETSKATNASPTHKRKRETAEQDDGHLRSPAASGRRTSKRVVSPNTVAATAEAPKGQAEKTNEASNDATASSTAAPDVNALTQQHGTEGGAQSNGASNASDATSTAVAALAGLFPTMTVPQPTDLSFASTASGDGDRNLDPSFNLGEGDSHASGQNFDLEALRDGSGRDSTGGQKPAVGSEEWHRVRRDNHKEVERRRRETINEGINELAKIVPGCEKNKGSILQRAVAFITQLKENEAQNIEKWTLEKLLTEQAIAELSASVDKLKNECERAWREAETWKKTCQSAGLTARGEDGNTSGGNGTEES
ncbi:MAG: basic helix-loop-helix protein [Thelocarpon superellum]|nr:MAG: basic helix-loop-helix protein [Thelocarpon superellum]